MHYQEIARNLSNFKKMKDARALHDYIIRTVDELSPVDKDEVFERKGPVACDHMSDREALTKLLNKIDRLETEFSAAKEALVKEILRIYATVPFLKNGGIIDHEQAFEHEDKSDGIESGDDEASSYEGSEPDREPESEEEDVDTAVERLIADAAKGFVNEENSAEPSADESGYITPPARQTLKSPPPLKRDRSFDDDESDSESDSDSVESPSIRICRRLMSSVDSDSSDDEDSEPSEIDYPEEPSYTSEDTDTSTEEYEEELFVDAQEREEGETDRENEPTLDVAPPPEGQHHLVVGYAYGFSEGV